MPANAQIALCELLFDETVAGRRSGVSIDHLATRLHGEATPHNRDRVRKAIARAIERIDLARASGNVGFKLEKLDEIFGLEGTSEDREFSPHYRISLDKHSSGHFRDPIHLGRYVGRSRHVDTFLSAVNGDTEWEGSVLSLHGFGGIGKSTLLEVFRHEASRLDLVIKPHLFRDQIVADSVSNWLSEVFLFDYAETQRTTQKWRDFLDVLEPRTLVLVDTTADVDMAEFNRTFATLAKVLKDESSDCFIVTATREKPHYSFRHLPVDGLNKNEIALLSEIDGWPDDIADHSDRLWRETDGNPFVLEAVCRNTEIWSAFKSGTFDLTRHAEPVAYLLHEMWEALSNGARDGLSLLSAMAVHAPKWQFTWDEEDCQALLGPAWQDIKFELTGKRFMRPADGSGFVIHELVGNFAFPRLTSPENRFRTLGDHFAAKDAPLVATRFLAMAERWSPKS